MTHPRAGRGLVAVVLAVALLVVLVPAAGAQSGTTATSAAPAPAAPPTPVLSARRFPGVLQGAVADPKLAAALDPVLARGAGSTCVRVQDRGRPALVRDPGAVMVPASLEKLLTATAAIEVLGPDRRLTTTVSAASAPADGVVKGDLFVVGGGDPLLTTVGYKSSFEDPNQTINPFEALADSIVKAGVTRIDGNVVGDDSAFSEQRWIPSWPTRYQRQGFIGPISALMVNDGFTGYTDTPEQPTDKRDAGDPPALAAQTLVTLLRQRGVQVSGQGTAGKAPAGAKEITHFDSLPMSQIIGEMLSESDNTTAELLTREMGLVARKDPSTPAGISVIVDTLDHLGLPTKGLALKDGSGLDPTDQVPCDLILAALDRAGPDSLIGHSLAVAGQSGTLLHRLGDKGIAGQLHGKTGTLNEVNALAGFATTATGGQLTFLLLQNGLMAKGPDHIDELARAMMTYPEGPPLGALGPTPTGG